VRAVPELLGAPTIGGGSAWPWGGGGEVIYTFTAKRNSQKRQKTGGFAHVFAYKSLKTPFFAIKYLTRYTHETFFEEYINMKIFPNLSHCGVIPVRSFRSQIRPQPHGLGLTTTPHTKQCHIIPLTKHSTTSPFLQNIAPHHHSCKTPPHCPTYQTMHRITLYEKHCKTKQCTTV
jgi:hypothetical protein